MNSYKANYESRDCACGGRHNLIPTIKAKHEATRKHRSWRWRTLCEAMLTEGLAPSQKRELLLELRGLVAFG